MGETSLVSSTHGAYDTVYWQILAGVGPNPRREIGSVYRWRLAVVLNYDSPPPVDQIKPGDNTSGEAWVQYLAS